MVNRFLPDDSDTSSPQTRSSKLNLAELALGGDTTAGTSVLSLSGNANLLDARALVRAAGGDRVAELSTTQVKVDERSERERTAIIGIRAVDTEILRGSKGTRMEDGSTVYADRQGRPTGIVFPRGGFAAISYDDSNAPIRVVRGDASGAVTLDEKRDAGASWTAVHNGKSSTFEGDYQIKPNGSLDFVNKDSTVDRWYTNGGKVFLNQNGRPQQMNDAKGIEYLYGYDQAGMLDRVRQSAPDGRMRSWQHEEGVWRLYDKDSKYTGTEFRGQLSVDPDGTLRMINGRGDITLMQPDGRKREIKSSVTIGPPIDDRPYIQNGDSTRLPGGPYNYDYRTNDDYMRRDGYDRNSTPGTWRTTDKGMVRTNIDDSQTLYDATGTRPMGVISRDGTSRKYEYDSQGRLISNTSFDGNGNMTGQLKLTNGRWTLTSNDGVSNLPEIKGVSVTADGSMVTRFVNGAVTVNKYDSSVLQYSGKRVVIIDPTGEKKRVTFDANKNPVMLEYMYTDQRDVALSLTKNGWVTTDNQGRQVMEPLVQSVKVDGAGNVEITRTNGKTMMYTDGRRKRVN